MPNTTVPQKDSKTRLLVEKGRRAKWWQRRGSKGRGFSYFTHNNQRINDEDSLAKISSLVIPPAWKYVRISPASSGKVRAVGIDTSGRLQYIYDPKFTEKQQRKKFARIERFGEYMPRLRKITNEHISLDGFPKEKVLAIMTRLINSLYIRIGTDHSVKNFRTYGITTLGNRHVQVGAKGKAIFEFVGKSQIKHRKVLVDAELSKLVAELTTFGRGRKLFQYQNGDGKFRAVKPAEINAYIKSVTSDEFTSKDFRTWGASLLAADKLARIGVEQDEAKIKKNIVRMVRQVAEELGNTPAVCRSSYIHPKIIHAYSRGITIDAFTSRSKRQLKRIESEDDPSEDSLMRLFKS